MTYECSVGTQDLSFCPTTIDEIFPSTIALLPEGPAWDGVQEPGTVLNLYWRSISSIVGYVNERICAFIDELHCSTAAESIDQWNFEYGIGEKCDPYGEDLCRKVTAVGGQSCSFFVDLARQLKWVISCEDMAVMEPIAGCFEVGCTPLGPTPVLRQKASNIGVGSLAPCAFGEVVQHPHPPFWDTRKAHQSDCWVPGSNLGFGPDTDESCCFIVGWWEPPADTRRYVRGICTTADDSIEFECVRTQCTPIMFEDCDTSKEYSEWGQAHAWRVVVDVNASMALQNVSPIDLDHLPFNAGNIEAGCAETCAPANPAADLICWLEKVKPAHTTLFVELLQ